MKKIYNIPAERVINLGTEENLLLTVSGETPAEEEYNPDGNGNNDSREIGTTNLWNQEW